MNIIIIKINLIINNKCIFKNLRMNKQLKQLPLLLQKKSTRYDYLPWHHSTFESWKLYISQYGDKNGAVHGPITQDNGYTLFDYYLFKHVHPIV